jgi:hypothetical protein
MWTLTDFRSYLDFINNYLFTWRAGIYILVCIVLFLLQRKIKSRANGIMNDKNMPEWLLLFVPSLIFSVIIYTLDKGVMYYFTPMYIPIAFGLTAILFSMVRQICSKEMASICITLVLALYIVNPLATVDNLQEKLDKYNTYQERYSIAVENKDYDCIYVEEIQDNLLQGLWFELGEYHQFKKISADDFLDNGLTPECMEGRETPENAVIVYLPSRYEWDNSEAELLMENGGFKIYKWEM